MYRFLNKTDYINKTDDIEKCNSRVWHFELNKPEYNLTNKDIPGTSPKYEKFSSKRTPHNPLEPNYKLPTYEKIPYDIPKFIRDTLNTKDIPGSFPKKQQIWQTKKNENNFNIKKSPIKKDNLNNYNYIDYSDISKKKFKTSRNINPLDPVYDVKFDNKPIGPIDKSKPNPLYALVYSNPINLKTDDISGAQKGTLNKINKFSNTQTNNLIISDIPGALSGSLKNHIVTNRQSNPVCPEYEMPGHTDKGENFNSYGNNNKTQINQCIEKEKDIQKTNENKSNKEIILEEINDIRDAYLKSNEKMLQNRPKSQVPYSYSRSYIKNNLQSTAKPETNIKNNDNKLKKKIGVDQFKNKDSQNDNSSKNFTGAKGGVEDKDENKIYKRLDSRNNITFVGKENLKQNEIIGFNNQLYNIPP